MHRVRSCSSNGQLDPRKQSLKHVGGEGVLNTSQGCTLSHFLFSISSPRQKHGRVTATFAFVDLLNSILVQFDSNDIEFDVCERLCSQKPIATSRNGVNS